jgi:hypothetical protein
MFRKLTVLLLVSMLAIAMALPSFAQTATPDPGSQVVVVGPVDLGQGVIMVNNYIIAPASAFQPSILHQGDVVVAIGYLLPDGVTIQATSLEFFEGSPTPTFTPTYTPNPSITPTMTPHWTATFTPLPPTPVPTKANCNHPDQPVAQRLATAFNVSYNEIIGWFCQGFGFGEIARAYLLADATGVPAANYFAMRQSGMGWGEIVKQTGVHPSDLAPGQVIRRGNGNGNDENGNGNGNGHGNGHGNGNGNNGNGKGNGKGNGDDNGNDDQNDDNGGD